MNDQDFISKIKHGVEVGLNEQASSRLDELTILILFFVFMSAITLATIPLHPTSRQVPLYVLAIFFIVWFPTFLSLVSENINISESFNDNRTNSEKSKSGTKEDADSGQNSQFEYELDFKNTVKPTVWVTAFLFGLMNIGFFTTTFLFTSVYLYLYYSDKRYKFASPIAWAVIVTIIQYFFFIELLNSYWLFRLGLLP